MNRNTLIEILKSASHSFADTVSFIEEHYHYRASGFDNGPVRNDASENQGSCKVLAMALDLGLSDSQALQCFAEHYQAVLTHPDGSDHANIRALREHGLATVDSTPHP